MSGLFRACLVCCHGLLQGALVGLLGSGGRFGYLGVLSAGDLVSILAGWGGSVGSWCQLVLFLLRVRLCFVFFC